MVQRIWHQTTVLGSNKTLELNPDHLTPPARRPINPTNGSVNKYFRPTRHAKIKFNHGLNPECNNETESYDNASKQTTTQIFIVACKNKMQGVSDKGVDVKRLRDVPAFFDVLINIWKTEKEYLCLGDKTLEKCGKRRKEYFLDNSIKTGKINAANW